MMERRRRQAAVRVQQKQQQSSSISTIGDERSSPNTTMPGRTNQNNDSNRIHHDTPVVRGGPNSKSSGSLMMRKRDLLAKSRRSLSEPHRRVSSPPPPAITQTKSEPAQQTAAAPPSNNKKKMDDRSKDDNVIHDANEERGLFTSMIQDQRERRLYLKSKAKQLVLSKRTAQTAPALPALEPTPPPVTAAPEAVHTKNNSTDTEEEVIPAMLFSPRRIAELRKKSDQLHSSMAKAVLAQRKKPPAQQHDNTTMAQSNPKPTDSTDSKPASTTTKETKEAAIISKPMTEKAIMIDQEETAGSSSHARIPNDALSKKFLLRHHKLSMAKGVTKQESLPVIKLISEVPNGAKDVDKVESAKSIVAQNGTKPNSSEKSASLLQQHQRQPIGVVKAAKESFSVAKAAEAKKVASKRMEQRKPTPAEPISTKPEPNMNQKPSATMDRPSDKNEMLLSTKTIELVVADKAPTSSFLHQKAARHKQQRDLRRKSAPCSDTKVLLTDELTAILSVDTTASESVEERLVDESSSSQLLSTFHSDGTNEMIPEHVDKNGTERGIIQNDAKTCSEQKQKKIDESVNEEQGSCSKPISIEVQPCSVQSKPVGQLVNDREIKPSLLHRIRQEGVNEAIKQLSPRQLSPRQLSPRQLSPRHHSPRQYTFDTESDGPMSPRNGSLSPLVKKNDFVVSPTQPVSFDQPVPDSPKRDRMKFIRADEYEYVHETVHVPTTFNTALHVDKTVASRLDSPVKKMAAPFAVFDLIEIMSVDDEDRHAFDSVLTTQSSSIDRDVDDEPVPEQPKSGPLRVDIECYSEYKESSVNSSPATEAAAIAYETPCAKVTDHGATLSTTDSLDEILATPKEFDFRPLPTLESAVVESSWDANKVLFNEYRRPREKKELSCTEEIVPKDNSSTPLPLIVPVVDDTMDPLGWPRSPPELLETDGMSLREDENLSCHDDDENLLIVNRNVSDDMDDDEYHSPKSKEERIEEYERREHDEESSPEEDEDSSDAEEEVEIGYISQESETVDDVNDDSYEPHRNPRVFFPDELAPVGSEDNPIQIPVVLDLTDTDLQPAETLSADDLDSLLASTVGDVLSPQSLLDTPIGRDHDDLKLLPPPPPPPPPHIAKTNRTIPLLAPPPEEKIAQWEAIKAGSKPTVANITQSLENGVQASDRDRLVLMQRNQEMAPRKDLLDDAKNGKRRHKSKTGQNHHPNLLIFPISGESPFDKAIKAENRILKHILDFLGDPVAVCRTKMLSKSCQRFVRQNEHTLMRDAVRLGGMNMNVRPYFWLWVTLEKAAQNDDDVRSNQLRSLEKDGRAGKWSHVIERDVSRAFGNLPPHKSGARLRTDSIVRALVSWGKSRVVNKGVRGSGDVPSRTEGYESDEISAAPTDTVSDWGGVTPVGSFGGSVGSSQSENEERTSKSRKHMPRADEMALSGNSLSEDVKKALQHKLSFILHALAALNGDVGYCQGMDYVVAHLLRILQDTIRWKAANGTLPSIVENKPKLFGQRPLSREALQDMYAEVDRSLVVEETCFRVMSTFFTTYSLEHFYWPELRCLKTCCRVFEKLIQIKLPVLADHFEHHELNVGLFALGWFQTLFLYLPSMPSATVCHMWDIWLVERSFKIFFRVGTAILFLSQPTLLNYELEGMMSYLNTFPDATLLSPDILIACALQIKVTNTMLMELEEDVKRTTMTC